MSEGQVGMDRMPDLTEIGSAAELGQSIGEMPHTKLPDHMLPPGNDGTAMPHTEIPREILDQMGEMAHTPLDPKLMAALAEQPGVLEQARAIIDAAEGGQTTEKPPMVGPNTPLPEALLDNAPSLMEIGNSGNPLVDAMEVKPMPDNAPPVEAPRVEQTPPQPTSSEKPSRFAPLLKLAVPFLALYTLITGANKSNESVLQG